MAPYSDTLSLPPRHPEETSESQDIQWEFVEKIKGKPTIYLLDNLHNNDGGMAVMNRLIKAHNKVARPQWYHAPLEIHEAIISPYSIGDVEAQVYPREVIVQSFVPRLDLTEAFHNPVLLTNVTNFVGMNEQFSVSSPSDRPHRAILMTTSIDKRAWVMGVLAGVLFSTAVGVVVGVVEKRADWGLAATACIVATLTLLLKYLYDD